MKNLTTVLDYQRAAAHKLGPGLMDYIQRTAGVGSAFRANLSAFDGYRILEAPGSAQPVESIDTFVRGVDGAMAMPIMVAPTAFHKLFHPGGEAATYEAARALCTRFVISSFSTLSFREIGENLSSAWYQLLMYRDLAIMKASIDWATDSGCSAIVITIDAPEGCSMCKRDPSVPAVQFPKEMPLLPTDDGLQFADLDEYYAKYMPGRIIWPQLAQIVEYTSRTKEGRRVPVILKGAQSASEIVRSAHIGAAGVIVSNHGGRQNDKAPATLDILATLSEDVKKMGMPIYLDGGIRTGADVFKAIALGARAVLVGRPILYGLAVDGAHGAFDILGILENELQQCMKDAGCASLADITSDKVAKK